jgi:hypothetical protein
MTKNKGDYTALIPFVLFFAFAALVAYAIIRGNKSTDDETK